MDFLQLPFELQCLILSDLNPEEVMGMRLVSKDFRDVASNEVLWLYICKGSFSEDVNKEIDSHPRRSWFRFYLEMRELEKADTKSYVRLCDLLMSTRDSEIRARSLLYLDCIPFEVTEEDLKFVSCKRSKFSVVNTFKDTDAWLIEDAIETSLTKYKDRLEILSMLSRKKDEFISRWDK